MLNIETQSQSDVDRVAAELEQGLRNESPEEVLFATNDAIVSGVEPDEVLEKVAADLEEPIDVVAERADELLGQGLPESGDGD